MICGAKPSWREDKLTPREVKRAEALKLKIELELDPRAQRRRRELQLKAL